MASEPGNASQRAPEPRYLVTGALGFLGAHLVRNMAARGHPVSGIDNLSRPAAARRRPALEPLLHRFLQRSVESVPERWIRSTAPTRVIHLAGQVGLSESWANPILDYRSNAVGTWNLLCRLRNLPSPPAFVLISSNKVYGRVPPRKTGVPESAATVPDSPYALSKSSAEEAVRVAHRAGWVRGVILRCSCLYGPDQQGTESQGWVSHFARAALDGNPVRIHGTGTQVRDALHVDDWLTAVNLALQHTGANPQAPTWNIGGGPENILSPGELWRLLADLLRRRLPPPEHTDARPGDQMWFVSDIRRAARELGWQPTISVKAGLESLLREAATEHLS